MFLWVALNFLRETKKNSENIACFMDEGIPILYLDNFIGPFSTSFC